MIIFYIGQKGFQASEQQKFNTVLSPPPYIRMH